jgi:hypothetical protein
LVFVSFFQLCDIYNLVNLSQNYEIFQMVSKIFIYYICKLPNCMKVFVKVSLCPRQKQYMKEKEHEKMKSWKLIVKIFNIFMYSKQGNHFQISPIHKFHVLFFDSNLSMFITHLQTWWKKLSNSLVSNS